MQKKLKKFLHEYRNALIVAVMVCVPLVICLYFLVPQTPVNEESSSDAVSQDLIMGALSGGKSVSCVFNGDIKGTAYVDNGDVRIITKSQNILYIHEKVYIWSEASTSGQLVDIAKFPLAKSFINPTQIKKQIDKYQPVCEESTIDKNILLPDSRIKYLDYSPSFGDVMKMQ